MSAEFRATIHEGDTVMISGGGVRRLCAVRRSRYKFRLGSTGSFKVESLVGQRYGGVFRFDGKSQSLIATNEYPDLDISVIQATMRESRDNRNLVDTNTSQRLSNAEVAAIRQEHGVEELLTNLVESSATFATKTAFAQEKYLRRKQRKYTELFKVERVAPDNLCEMYIPTVCPADEPAEEARSLRLRSDTLTLMLHHANIHSGSRVLVWDKSNGVLPAAILNRFTAHDDRGLIFQFFDKSGQPNIQPAQQMQLPLIKTRWKAVPLNPAFLTGEPAAAAAASDSTKEAVGAGSDRPDTVAETSMGLDANPSAEPDRKRRRNQPAANGDGADAAGASQWLRGGEARTMLLHGQLGDTLIVVDDDNPLAAVRTLLPFLSPSGHVVVYSPFLEDVTAVFQELRGQSVNLRISETWYRHQQVLTNRTHPTVNMSTAAGYLLTGIKVELHPSPRPRLAATATPTPSTGAGGAAQQPERAPGAEPEAKEPRTE